MSDAELLTHGRLMRLAHSVGTWPNVLRLARSMRINLADQRHFTRTEWPSVVVARILTARRRERVAA